MASPAQPRFASISAGRQRCPQRRLVPRHRHARPYAALVLRGGYEEAGDSGRWRVAPGDILFHDCFHAHLDRFGQLPSELLNIALPAGFRPPAAAASVADADAIVCASTRDLQELLNLLSGLDPLPPVNADWPDLLAEELISAPNLCLSDWADRHRLTPIQVSRGFRQLFGTSPKRFRAEARARSALGQISAGRTPLAGIAADAGFADQAHMTRAVAALTGRPPRRWRRSETGFKTEARQSG